MKEQKTFLKLLSWNSLSVFAKIISGFITSKLVAIYVGPSGMAVIGNFRNFISIIENFATLGTTNGVIKMVSENEANFENRRRIIQTIFGVVSVLLLLIIGILFFCKNIVIDLLFDNQNLTGFEYGITLLLVPFYIFSLFTMAIVNGLNKIKELLFIQLLGTFLGLLFSIYLVVNYKVTGAMFAILAAGVLLFFISVFYLIRKENFANYFTSFHIDKTSLRELFHYSLMFLATAFLSPLSNFLIRKKIIAVSGWHLAGNWEALNRISGIYFLFITTILTVYFLPKFSQSETKNEKDLVKQYFTVVMPLFCFGLLLLYFFKDFFVRILLSNEFSEVPKMLLFQIIGDFFKASSFVFAYYLIAKKLLRPYVFFEILSFGILLITNYFAIANFKVMGALYAYDVTYFSYFAVLLLFYFKTIKHK